MSDGMNLTGLEVAIIGKAGRFPGARDLDAFWRNLRDGVESIAFFSPGEVEAAGVSPEVIAHPAFVPAHGALDDIELFDAELFGYSPREAGLMDPQQRVMLECAWAALEDAGYDPRRYRRPVGVYGGMSLSSYVIRLLGRADLLPLLGGTQGSIANLHDFLCTRISFKLGLEGPSVTVQTACSTALVAVHMACQALLSGECEMVLAGGVSIRVPQQGGYVYERGGAVSADGHCRPFDARATGTVAGAGAGVVVLKRLERALADGDSICAVIKGSAINNDGAVKASFTAPRVDGQAKVIRAAQVLAEVDVETITYVETHGTATPLGDPIELAALTRAFRAGTAKSGFCAIGSVKANIGHLDAAAGIASLLKTVLALEHGALPPSLNFERPNPELDFAGSPFYVNTRLQEWRPGPGPRRAGVSSFGMGGTNAHLILEEAPPPAAGTPGRPWQLLVLSAQTEAVLDEATVHLGRHLRSRTGLDLADVAFTGHLGRQQLPVRRMLVSRSLEDAAEALETRDPARLRSARPGSTETPVGFLLPGIGGHYVGMGRGLYRDEPAFRRELDRCAELALPLLGCDLREVLFPAADAGDEVDREPGAGPKSPPRLDLRAMVRPARQEADPASQRLNQTALAQPATFILEYALARLWISWGVRPDAMIGHSLGEYVAACLAGVLSLEDALTLVVQRAKMIDTLPAGGMLAVALSEPEVEGLLREGGGELSLAAVNGVSLCVVAGPLAGLARLEQQLAARQVEHRRLDASHPFHSRQLAGIAGPFLDLVRSFELRPPRIPYVSNVTGIWIEPSQATDPAYWLEHLCGTVRFAQGVSELWQEPGRVLLEVGPGLSLGQLALQQLGSEQPAERLVLSSLGAADGPRQADQELVLESLGRLWLAGVEVDWEGFHAGERRRRVSLPSYPFQRQRHWLEAGGPAITPFPAEVRQTAPRAEARPAPRHRQAAGGLEPAPRTDVERRLVEIWQELLGHREVGLDANFFVLGGNSLLAVTLSSRVETAFGVGLPPHALLAVPTVTAMAEVIAAQLSDLPEAPKPAQQLHDSCLVEMQSGDATRLPIYFVHPSGGQVYLYRDLAPALGADQPVYGLRARGVEDNEETHRSVEEMAAHYVDAVRSLQPAGPYLLGGGSMGGMIAFEMAQQLRALGQEVAVLAMFDTAGLGQLSPVPADRAELMYKTYRNALTIELDELRRRNDDEQVSYILEAARGVDMLEGVSPELARRFVEVDARLGRLAFEYQARPYPGSILFFRAQDHSTVSFTNPERDWIDLALGGIEIHVVPGTHISMHHAPQNTLLAATLRAALDRACAAPRSAGTGRATAAPASGTAAVSDLLRREMARAAGVPEAAVTAGRPLLGLGFDSLAKVELQHGIEQALDVALPLDELMDGIDLAGLEQLVLAALAGQAAPGGGGPDVAAEPIAAPGVAAGPVAVEGPALGATAAELPLSPGQLTLWLVQQRGPGLDRESLLALPPEDRPPVLQALLQEELARLAGAPAYSIDLTRPVTTLGLDSLGMVELQHRLESRLTLHLPLAELLDGLDLTELAGRLAAGLEGERRQVRERERAQEAGVHPASHGQRALWQLHQVDPEHAACNLASAAVVRSGLDSSALARCFQILVDRHAALRTTFEMSAGELVQRIHERGALDFACEEAFEWSPKTLRGRLEEEADRPFNLEKGPLLRIRVFGCGSHEAVLLLVLHHIAADLWSLAILLRELESLYRQESGGTAAMLEPPRFHPGDHARREQARLAGTEGERLWAYWQERLAGVANLDLPMDRRGPAWPRYRGSSAVARLPAASAGHLRALGAGAGATLYMTLLAGFHLLLRRYTGQRDFLVGSLAAGRGVPDAAGVVGYFVNPLPIRAVAPGDPGFLDLLHGIRGEVLGALAHQDFPYQLLAERVQPDRDPDSFPLFQTLCVLQKVPSAAPAGLDLFALGEDGAILELGPLELESLGLERRRVQFELLLMAAENAGALVLSLQHASDLFDRTTAGRMLGHFRELLAAAAAEPRRRISSLALLTPAEAHQLLHEESLGEKWAATRPCLQRLFEEQAVRTPDAVALASAWGDLTYLALDRLARRLARRLQALGVGPEVRVGLCAERSPELVVGLLAILKAGGVHVPLDPAYPRNRLAFLLADSGARLLLAQLSSIVGLATGGATLVDLDRWRGEADLAAVEPMPVSPENLAYVIYTSGSTGLPKGVAVTHRSALALMDWARATYADDELAGVLASTSVCFDLSVFELFAPLSWGGTVILADHLFDLPLAPRAGRVTLVNTVPSVLSELLETTDLPPGIRTVNLAGEPLPRSLVERLCAGSGIGAVYNCYGPTEDTTYSTFARVGREGGAVPIGRPVHGGRAYLLDAALEPVPAGLPGELYLAGAGLARGYLGRPDLTAASFLPDPHGPPGSRLYRTGDLARRGGGGEIEFLGRLDDQVKVRGFRIEPGEVESVLRRHGALREAAVAPYGEGSDRRLVAYVVPRKEAPPAAEELRRFVAERLPAHMVPAAFVPLATLPSTHNGKLDRRALPDPGGATREGERVAPRSDLEAALAEIWSDVLQSGPIGVHDSFFALGGHSLKAFQVLAKIRASLGVEVPIHGLFATPTVAWQARAVVKELARQAGEEALTALAEVEEER